MSLFVLLIRYFSCHYFNFIYLNEKTTRTTIFHAAIILLSELNQEKHREREKYEEEEKTTTKNCEAKVSVRVILIFFFILRF